MTRPRGRPKKATTRKKQPQWLAKADLTNIPSAKRSAAESYIADEFSETPPDSNQLTHAATKLGSEAGFTAPGTFAVSAAAGLIAEKTSKSQSARASSPRSDPFWGEVELRLKEDRYATTDDLWDYFSDYRRTRPDGSEVEIALDESKRGKTAGQPALDWSLTGDGDKERRGSITRSSFKAKLSTIRKRLKK